MNVWPWIAVALTLIVLSRALGDNPLFRFSQYLFVGLALGYTTTIVINDVLVDRIGGAMNQADPVGFVFLAAPVILGLLLWTRLGNQNMSWLANIPLALMFGVAAALALGGTILGTLLPQLDNSLFSVRALSSAPPEVMVGRVVVLVGIILVLMSFRFTRQSGKQPPAVERGIARLGRWWLLISLGVVFAGALITYQSALIDRIQFVTRQFGLG
ncbi:MAG TPA: hypothetical protein VD886_25730 [Herpetosiphonaceae bacterium]|nr:hypothetical protein [Herpetosiphonaceae bacterium]